MFVSKKSNLNEWKNWAIGLIDSTMSSVDQATSRWFWNLINGLPRDYFAQTFDQVNYLDKRVWEGMFRARIDEIKEQLELGVSESMFEADLVKLQGLVGKYSLSPVTYEDGLEELENFISTLGNGHHYLKILREVRNEFREELKSQPALLKECIEGEVNLGKKEGAYYKSVSDDRSLKHAGPKRVVSKVPIPDKAPISRKGNSNSKLRNISKLLFSNPGQALTLFLAAQSAFASAANIQMSNDTLPFNNNLITLPELEGGINQSVSIHSISKSSNLRNSNEVRKEIEVVERNLDGRSTEIRDDFKDLRDTGELVEVLTYVKSQRFKRSANESLSEMETVPENQEEIIIGLENKVKELEKEIEQLKNSISASDSSYKNRIASIKEQKAILQGSLDNLKKQSGQKLSAKANEIQGLNAMVGNLKKDIEDLTEQIAENKRRYLPYFCIRDIEDRNFNSVEENLKKMNNTEVKEVIEKVYNNNAEGRFSLLLGFGKNLRSIPLTLSVYTFLDNEMRKVNNGNNDIFEAIDLANAVKSEVINQENVSYGTKEKASNLLNNLQDRIKNMAVKELSDAMKNKTYDKGDRNVFKISKAVSSLNQELFRDFITNVIDDVYDQVDTGSVILDFIYQSGCPERMHGYKAILEKMKDQNHLDFRSEAVELSRCIRDLMNGACGTEEKMIAQSLKKELPDYLQVAIFAGKVCIKNARYGEYLYAAVNYFNYDSDRRSVFTWCPGDKISNGYWILSSDKRGYFSIKNTQHGEYLFVSQIESNTEEMICNNDIRSKWKNTIRGPFSICVDHPHKVFTWVPKSKDNDADWEFLLDAARPHTMRIRNVYHNRFLYASYSNYDDNRRRVYAANDVESGKDLWEIEDCSHMRRRRDVQSYSEPSSYLSDIALEKTTGKNSSFISR